MQHGLACSPPWMSTVTDRRQQILDAALAAFVAEGYAGTSIADIRARSGASTGSIYHLFSSKAEIALTLLDMAIAQWSQRTADRIGRLSGDLPAEVAIRGSVEALLVWGSQNPGLFRFLDEVLARGAADTSLAPFAARQRDGQAEAARLYDLWTRRGEVRPLPFAVAHALMLGPTYAYLRTPPLTFDGLALVELPSAAWEAVRAT